MKLFAIASSAILALAVSTDLVAAECSKVYGQCGGKDWKGPTCCEAGSHCVSSPGNPWYSQCLPGSGSSNSNNNGKKPTRATTKPKHTTAASQKPKHTTGSNKSSGYSVIPGGISGTNAASTQYWDCCKASCSWPGRGSVTAPVNSCAKNGVTLMGNNVLSACNGGTSYMCNNNQPWVVNDKLAYGFSATVIRGKKESDLCCACFELTFTNTPIAGKKMIVQVTNTGSYPMSESAHFDLQMPGGGVGEFNACTSQWNAPPDGWGRRYGGTTDVSQCSQLPSVLQPGCRFRYGWFQNANNPTLTYKQVTCPKELVARTGCQRKQLSFSTVYCHEKTHFTK